MPSIHKKINCAYVVWTKPNDPVPKVTYFRLFKEALAFSKDKLYEGRPAIPRKTQLTEPLARRAGILPRQ